MKQTMNSRLVPKAAGKIPPGSWSCQATKKIKNQKLQCALTGMQNALKRGVEATTAVLLNQWVDYLNHLSLTQSIGQKPIFKTLICLCPLKSISRKHL